MKAEISANLTLTLTLTSMSAHTQQTIDRQANKTILKSWVGPEEMLSLNTNEYILVIEIGALFVIQHNKV